MSAPAEPAKVSVRIMEKEYVVACAHEERSALLDAAEYLNARMREVRDTGKVVGNERIAIMAALNIAHEHLSNHPGAAPLDAGAFRGRIEAMQETVESALAADQENLF